MKHKDHAGTASLRLRLKPKKRPHLGNMHLRIAEPLCPGSELSREMDETTGGRLAPPASARDGVRLPRPGRLGAAMLRYGLLFV
jgi:hypothetical protein